MSLGLPGSEQSIVQLRIIRTEFMTSFIVHRARRQGPGPTTYEVIMYTTDGVTVATCSTQQEARNVAQRLNEKVRTQPVRAVLEGMTIVGST
jgi:hypothetical protein